MPTWAWSLAVAAALVAGAVGGFAFAAWLIGMERRDAR